MSMRSTNSTPSCRALRRPEGETRQQHGRDAAHQTPSPKARRACKRITVWLREEKVPEPARSGRSFPRADCRKAWW